MATLGTTDVIGELRVNGKRVPEITLSTGNPLGGNHGDLWFKYASTGVLVMNLEELTNESVKQSETSKHQDTLIMDNDLRLMDVEFALEQLNPGVTLDLKSISTLASPSFDLLMRMVREENYTSKEQMEANIKKYYDRKRITEEEYYTLIWELYPESKPTPLVKTRKKKSK